jgi:hypothetical protein
MRTSTLAGLGAAMLVSGCSLLAFDDLSSRYDPAATDATRDDRRTQDTNKTDPGGLESSSSGPLGESAADGGGEGGGVEAGPKIDGGMDSGTPRELPPPQTGTCTAVEDADGKDQFVSSAQVICGQLSTATDVDVFALALGGGGGKGTFVVKLSGGSGTPNIAFKRDYAQSADTATTLAPGQVGSIDTTEAATARVEIRAGSAASFPFRYYVEITKQNY